MYQEKSFSSQWLGRTLTIKTGKLARHAHASVTVQYGDTVVLATVVESAEERPGVNFFPLMVDFEEKLYAAGIIKGSRWIKREGRPSDQSILTGRMIDRSIRPLFDDSSRKDVQVVLSVLSVDPDCDYGIVSLIAASAALTISPVKWQGPIGGIKVGMVNGKLVFNPTASEAEESTLDLIVAGTAKKVIMIEAGAQEINEAQMLSAIMAALGELQPVIKLIEEMRQALPPQAEPVSAKLLSDKDLKEAEEKEKVLTKAKGWLKENIAKILFDKVYYTKGERKAAVIAIKKELDKFLFDAGFEKDLRLYAIEELVDKMVEAEVTRAILEEKRRVDGRRLDEIRPLYAEVGLLPRTHGSSLFSRGETQVMSITTLGAPSLEQSLEGLDGQMTKRYMHHYNFPPFSVGETRLLRGPGRREIGHGALAEKAIVPVLPSKDEFPYTIRVVSETLGSNGSSSMASTCASSLTLMDAGVPIKKAVAGIAIGLASNEDMSRWEILTDIQDLEDGKGGMDFKIAGTRDGITAIQLDTKTNGLTREIVEAALERGRQARLEILNMMDQVISRPRPELSPYAPRVISFYINPDKIREVIGSGGKVIQKIVSDYEVIVDIEEDGKVYVSGTDAEKSAQAVELIKNIARDFTPGEIFKGKVVRMLDFGAFVEIFPGREGMVHVSELAPYRVGKPSDLLQIGDEVTVKVKEIDDQGRLNLTMVGIDSNAHLWQNNRGRQTLPPRRSNNFDSHRRPHRPNFKR
ncbi:polyribonucleotide nucleotidyltransferase [Candidatus Parcubacteria bacterium]|nr:MAG: polyribonucleotide nucleotidyltransferase [Candidatus Parcubacteria bacterium]